MNYLTSISSSQDVQRDVNNIEIIFAITESNYSILQGDGDIETYRAFFNEVYK